MKLERVEGVLMLRLSPESYISFHETWVEQLRALPYEQYGNFIRKNVYPALSLGERSLWNKSTINNLDLQKAMEDTIHEHP